MTPLRKCCHSRCHGVTNNTPTHDTQTPTNSCACPSISKAKRGTGNSIQGGWGCACSARGEATRPKNMSRTFVRLCCSCRIPVIVYPHKIRQNKAQGRLGGSVDFPVVSFYPRGEGYDLSRTLLVVQRRLDAHNLTSRELLTSLFQSSLCPWTPCVTQRLSCECCCSCFLNHVKVSDVEDVSCLDLCSDYCSVLEQLAKGTLRQV